MATSDSPLSITASRGLSLALEQVSGQAPLTDAEWRARLKTSADKYMNGTADSSFDPETVLSFQGAFKIPYFSNAVTNTREKQAVAYNPPNGNNGPHGSIFLGGRSGIAELQIPTISTDSVPENLPNVTILQNWVDVYSKFPTPAHDGTSGSRIGWMKVINGKLYGSVYAYYSSASNDTNLFVIDSPSDMANSTCQGLVNMAGGDQVCRYMGEIPSAKQSMFGGKTHFAGLCLEISLIDRASFGHSFYSLNPSDLGASDTALGSTQFTAYPSSNPAPGFSATHTEVQPHYGALLGGSISDHCALPDASRDPQTFDGLALPDESIRKHILSYNTGCGFAFIPPNTNSVMFIGNNRGMRYGLGYKNYYIEDGPDGYQGGGYLPYSKFDFDNVYWTMNLSDIAGTVNGYDVGYQEFGVFDSNRWIGSAGRGQLTSGDYDAANSKVYLFHDAAARHNDFERAHVVSVYGVNS